MTAAAMRWPKVASDLKQGPGAGSLRCTQCEVCLLEIRIQLQGSLDPEHSGTNSVQNAESSSFNWRLPEGIGGKSQRRM